MEERLRGTICGIAKAVSGLASAVGSSTNVDPLPYLRLTLELSQSHHDNIYAIRVQISELTKSITAIENRLELLEKRESNSSQ